MKHFHTLVLSILFTILSIFLTGCYSNEHPDNPMPLAIIYNYPMQTYNFQNFDNLPETVRQNWNIVANRVFVVNDAAAFPHMAAFDDPSDLDRFNFKSYSMIVYYSRELGPITGSRYSFFKNPATGGYLYDIFLHADELDTEDVQFCFVRNISVVNKININDPINCTVYFGSN